MKIKKSVKKEDNTTRDGTLNENLWDSSKGGIFKNQIKKLMKYNELQLCFLEYVTKDEITKKLGDELNKVIKDGSQGKSGLGFTPTIRNVLAIFFANGEAFLRLMDDCHSEAWSKRDSEVRKKSISHFSLKEKYSL